MARSSSTSFDIRRPLWRDPAERPASACIKGIELVNRCLGLIVVCLTALVLVPAAAAHTLPVWKARAQIIVAADKAYGSLQGVTDDGATNCWRMTLHQVRCHIYVDARLTGYREHCAGTAAAAWAPGSTRITVTLIKRLACTSTPDP